MRGPLRIFARGLGWLLAGLIALAVYARVYIQRNLEDEPLREDAAFLALSERPPPEVIEPLTRVATALVWQDEERIAELSAHMRNEAWDEAFVERALRENAAALAAWDAALEQEELSLPGFDRVKWKRALEEARSGRSAGFPSADDDIAPALNVQIVAKLVRLDAERRARRGDAGAFERALEPARVSQRIARPAAVMESVVAGTIAAHGLQAVDRVISATRLSAGEARSRARAIDALRPSAAAWSAMWSSEYRQASLFWRTIFAWAARQPRRDTVRQLVLPEAYLLQLHASLNAEQRFYSQLANTSARICTESERDGRRSRRLSDLALYLRPNVGSQVLFEISHPNQIELDLRRCILQSRFGMMQALVALRGFQTQHDQLPESLDALVPTYLESVPRDWLGGGPIRYDRDRKRLWSIGRDFRDAGGVPEDPQATRWGDDAEPVVPIAF